MGAASTLVLAGMYPGLPRAILLEDPPAWWVTNEAGVALARPSPLRLGIIELKRKTREEMIAQARSQSPTWSEAELGPWADAKLRFSFNVLAAGEPAARGLARYRASHHLPGAADHGRSGAGRDCHAGDRGRASSV